MASRLAHALALLTPLALLGGAYVAQYGFGLYPCEMCWWQRYAHFAALALAVLAWVRGRDRWPLALAALAIAVGGLIGGFHAGVEYRWWEGLTACASTATSGTGNPLDAIMNAPLIRCDVAPWSLLGVSLAGWNFLFSLAAALAVFPVDGRAPGAGDMSRPRTDRMLRVDQAGEYGATRIYAGQRAVMGSRAPHADEVAEMARQEAVHLARFDAMMARRRVRPTALQPVWTVAGFVLGAASALAGPEAAMACTAAIEQEIDRHYTQQLEELGGSDPELAADIAEFRDDERAHRATALAAGAERAPLYPLFSGAIRLGCRLAIRLSERI